MAYNITVKSRGSFRNEVEAGGHTFTIDEPAAAGGENAGPSPYDLLGAALGGCTSMTLHYYAKRESLPLEGVEVTVSHDRKHAEDCADCLTKGGYIHEFDVRLKLEGTLSDEQRERLLAVARRCPVLKVLTSEVKVREVLIA